LRSSTTGGAAARNEQADDGDDGGHAQRRRGAQRVDARAARQRQHDAARKRGDDARAAAEASAEGGCAQQMVGSRIGHIQPTATIEYHHTGSHGFWKQFRAHRAGNVGELAGKRRRHVGPADLGNRHSLTRTCLTGVHPS
jgi:hypothetical protein